MRKLRSVVAASRGKSRQARRANRHRFCVERLEDRRLLAADFLHGGVLAEGEGQEPQVAIHLATTDLSGNPISTISLGQPFWLQATVEDLRLNAAGVFATYLDVEFDSSAATIPGPLVHGAGFQNVISGSIEPGLLDEVGGTSTTLFQTGGSVAELFSVLVTADTVGQLVFNAGPADIVPSHYVLLYNVDTPISNDSIDFGRVSIEVTQFDDHPSVLAFDDSYVVLAGSVENRLPVLVNDEGLGNLIISSVDDTGLSGVVSIAPNGRGLSYSPPADFSGSEHFSYTAMDENGTSDDANVMVMVNRESSGETIVSIRLEATDLSGAPINSIAEGSDFLLNAFVMDTRGDAEGVFSAYLDLVYNSSLIKPSGEIEIGSHFENGLSGDFETPGVVNEVGAFQQSLVPYQRHETRLFTIPFSAIGSGPAVFQSDPADVLPLHDVLVYGSNQSVSVEYIDYGGFTLYIGSDVIAVDDSFHIAEDQPVELSVLSNDVHKSGDQLRIVEVDTASLRGTVSISSDGRTLTYTPESGFGGTEQFSYIVEGQRGLDTAEVTLHTGPGAALDDVISFELATTDLNGNPIDLIEAGQQFWLTVAVDDLRGADVDDLGVFSAYFDLLYDADHVSVVASEEHRLSFDVMFGSDYVNGQQGRATVPGVIDEVGSFQSVLHPVGGDPLNLFAVRLQANSVRGGADVFVVEEDAQGVSLNILANDVAIDATTVFRSDPADLTAISDVLLFDPPEPVEASGIRFGETSLRIFSSGLPTITSVSSTSHGGSVTISADGQRLEYTPVVDFFGTETFTYTIDLGAPIDVEVVVTGVADAPQANDDSFRVRTNRTLILDMPDGPLANDVDVDGDGLEVTVVTGPEHGTLEITDTGSFVYVPSQDFIGLDQLTYRAFDGGLESLIATVKIIVDPPPVRIRLEVVDATGTPNSHVIAGEPLFLTALVQDLRDASHPFHGVGAAYLDVGFDPLQIAPVLADNEEFEIAIDFGDLYQNGRSVLASTEVGVLKNVGAFQSGFAPLGPDEVELFTVEMVTAELQITDDKFTVSMNSRVNSLDVLANEVDLTWEVEINAGPADDELLTDVAFFDPPVSVEDDDILYMDVTVTVGNGSNLAIRSVGTAINGGMVVITHRGKRIEYTPRRDFVGVDSFNYTVVNGNGAIGTGTVSIDVVESWQNVFNPFDVNSDGQVTALDVLALINRLNRDGAERVPDSYEGPHYFNVNGDGFLSPQDVLRILNYINGQDADDGPSAEGEASPSRSSELMVVPGVAGSIPWRIDEPLGTRQLAEVTGLSNSSWQKERFESPRPAASLDASVLERRWRFVSRQFEQPDDGEIEDDLIDGLDQLAADVAQVWVKQS